MAVFREYVAGGGQPSMQQPRQCYDTVHAPQNLIHFKLKAIFVYKTDAY
jgi:hypothetical protein